MRRKSETVPGLRPPSDREHMLVDRELIEGFRGEVKKPRSGYLVLSALAVVLLLSGVAMGNGTAAGCLAYLAIAALFACLYVGSRNLGKRQRELVLEMERREYLVVPAWAEEIRVGWNEGLADRHGETRIRLENGQLLEKKYIMPYQYALAAVQAGTNKHLPVLLVYIPSREYYRLVPRE